VTGRRRPSLLITREMLGPAQARACADYDVQLITEPKPLPTRVLLSRAAACEALLIGAVERLDAHTIRELVKSIKIVATHSVGFEHIDIEAARAVGLVITNTPDVLTDATAELAVLLVLAACRRSGEGERILRGSRWPVISKTGLLGRGLSGKRVGILGLGRVGLAIAARLVPFGVNLHYHSRRQVEAARSLGAAYHSTPLALFRVSDILIVAASATAQTRNIVDRAALAALPAGAFLVNIARGELVDEEAVFSALMDGHLAGAGIDVFANEPDINPRWLEFENVALLPHLGSATLETRLAMGMRALDNLDAYFRGERPRDQVAP
jgi:lactate dehydrogenase-like 2-hydroxyacid dehydrogenase